MNHPSPPKISRSGSRERTVLLGSHFSDNLSPGREAGTFWVAHVGRHDAALDLLVGSPWLRRLMRKLPLPTTPWSMGVLVDEHGTVLDSYEDADGTLASATSVFAPYRNRLFIGTFGNKFIVACDRTAKTEK
jgi:hypothetical protein